MNKINLDLSKIKILPKVEAIYNFFSTEIIGFEILSNFVVDNNFYRYNDFMSKFSVTNEIALEEKIYTTQQDFFFRTCDNSKKLFLNINPEIFKNKKDLEYIFSLFRDDINFIFEISEQKEGYNDFFADLNAIGLKNNYIFALDDFGILASNEDRMNNFDFAYIKFSKDFFSKDEKIISAAGGLLGQHDKKFIFEGIEKEEDIYFLANFYGNIFNDRKKNNEISILKNNFQHAGDPKNLASNLDFKNSNIFCQGYYFENKVFT